MFDKQFEQLFQALHRVEQQLSKADEQEKEILREELIALRSVCERFVEKWLAFEEKVASLAGKYGIQLDTPQLPQQTDMSKSKPIPGPDPKSTVHVQPISLAAPEEEEQIIRSFQKGLGYFDLLMFPDAIRELERVVELDGEFLAARLYLAFGYLGKEDYENAVRHLNLVAASASEPFVLALVHNTFGHIYAGKKDYSRAAEEFKQTAEYMPDFRDVYYNLGVCQYNQRLYHDALASFLVALEQAPDDWQTEKITARIWRKIGSLDKALQHIEKAYRLNSSDYEILMQYADLCMERGEYELSRSLYMRAERLYPASPGPLGGLGWIAINEGEYARAVACFKKQLGLSPYDRQALFNLGWASILADDTKQAERVFNQLTVSDPNWIQTRIGAARLALQQGDYQAALKELREAQKIDRNSKEAWFYKGLAHSGLGEIDQAEQCWNKCRELLAAVTETTD